MKRHEVAHSAAALAAHPIPPPPLQRRQIRAVIYLTPGRLKIWQILFRQTQRDPEETQMRTTIGIAAVLAIGLIWSVAVMSEWVPVVSATAHASHSLNHSTH